MKKLAGLLAVLSIIIPSMAFADSNVTASAGPGATVSPSGVTTVATGSSQVFTFGANQGFTLSSVSVDGASQGAVSSYSLTGDLSDHNIFVSASSNGGGAMLYCSGPQAPGWNHNLPDGGCGGKGSYVAFGAPYTLYGQVLTCNFFAGCMLP